MLARENGEGCPFPYAPSLARTIPPATQVNSRLYFLVLHGIIQFHHTRDDSCGVSGTHADKTLTTVKHLWDATSQPPYTNEGVTFQKRMLCCLGGQCTTNRRFVSAQGKQIFCAVVNLISTRLKELVLAIC